MEEFHAWCAAAQSLHPFGLLATSTHDTKRSEDVRARISVLSEIPLEWEETMNRWSSLNRRKRVADLPDRATEWMLYQTLVGAWPVSTERVLGFMEKAVREAKVHTSWEQPDQIYEGAVSHFTASVLRSKKFLSEVEEFVSQVRGPGRSNSLALKLLTLLVPGVPDLYQGSELWDLSLVDPDNRRPVDYGLRRRLLDGAPSLDLGAAWAGGDEVGLTKLGVVHRALALRSRRPASFGEGGRGAYHPIRAEGPAAEHAVTFARGAGVVCAVTRWPLRLERAGGWRATALTLPEGRWHDVLCGRVWEGRVRLAELLGALPVA
jgi:(1->4)-alpha-D-glucan 1-alpha-D-glucosylmutase